ncbi:MAG: type II secretion system protein GspL [Syntrophotaleaceae bacterium]
MAPLFVGVDLSDDCLRVAALDSGHEPLRVQALIEESFSSEEELIALLRRIFAEDLPRARKTVLAVSAGKGFFRRLSFPFADSEKISQAIPFELGSHVPVELSDHLTSFQKPVLQADGQYQVPTAAMPLAVLEGLVEPFEKAGVPLHVLDLAPFAYVAGLDQDLNNCLLVCAGREETIVAQVEDGRIADYRLQPVSTETPIEVIQEFIHIQCLFFRHAGAGQEVPLCLIGSRVGPELIHFLEKQGYRVVDEPFPALDGSAPERKFIPALLMAVGACLGDSRATFNFRQGPLASKNDWASLKKQLVFSGAIAALALVVLITALSINYVSRAGILSQLDRQVRDAYRDTFPNSKLIVDAPLQMQSQLQELEKRAAIFRVSGNLSPLDVLKEISERLKDIPDLEVRTYQYNQDFVRLEGTTKSFEDVNRMSGNLRRSNQFGNVEISEAKMSLDGQNVNFRVQFALKGGPSGS